MLLPSLRRTYLLIFAAATALIIAALIMQYQFDMEPCPLCISQRIFVMLVGIVGILAWLQNPDLLGRRIYAGIGVIFSVVGGGISARHVWLQNLPEDQVPTCGPGLSYMFDALPFWDAMSLLFSGDGNCAEVSWQFLGLSIPAWTLVCFVGFAAVFIWQLLRRNAN